MLLISGTLSADAVLPPFEGHGIRKYNSGIVMPTPVGAVLLFKTTVLQPA